MVRSRESRSRAVSISRWEGPNHSSGPFPSSSGMEITLPTRSALEVWTEYQYAINQHFHDADFEALKLPIVAIAAHCLRSVEPIWPVIIGPASTGKTELGIMPLRLITSTEFISDLSPKAFIAGAGNKSGSLLHDTGDSGIWLIKDLTTILSKREADMKEVFGYLRETYDGLLNRKVGGKKLKMWEGKVTIVAACTPYIDRAWNFVNELGDRFVFIRWKRGQGQSQAKCAMRQLGGEKGIRAHLSTLAKELVEGRLTKMPPLPSMLIQDHIANLSEFCAQLRRRVVRDSGDSRRPIIAIPEAEGTGRLAKSLCMLLMFHSALFEVEPEEDLAGLALISRIALETIPENKCKFMESLNLSGDTDWIDVYKRANLPKSSITWLADELISQGVITRTGGGESADNTDVSYCISNEISDLWREIKAVKSGTSIENIVPFRTQVIVPISTK